MKLLLTLLLLHSTLSQQFNLTLYNNVAMNITAGFSFITLLPSSQNIYAIVANSSHFKVMNFDWTNNFAFLDESPFISAFIDLVNKHNKNPAIYYPGTTIQVRFYTDSAATATLYEASPSALSTYTTQARG